MWNAVTRGCRRSLAVAGLWLGIGLAHAGLVYTETGDAAGELTSTARPVGTADPIAIDAIRGRLLMNLAPDRADLFAFELRAGTRFEATTTRSALAYNQFDMWLFLFDALGRGVLANDDDGVVGGPQSTIAFLPVSSGVYFLGIAGVGYAPAGPGGDLFDGVFGTTTLQAGANGPGAAGGLDRWTGDTGEGGAYEIALAGATSTHFVPAPGSLWLAGLALLAAGALTRRHRPRALPVLLLAAVTAQAQHLRLDTPLSDLVDRLNRAAPALQVAAAGPRSRTLDDATTDAAGRVLVEVHLDGQVPLAVLERQLQAAGAVVEASDPHYRHGTIAASVPPTAITAVSSLPGIKILRLALRPQHQTGAVPTAAAGPQGADVIKSRLMNDAGYRGFGVTVGVISDSFDTSWTASLRYADDIASGDLPRTSGTPAVKLVQDRPRPVPLPAANTSNTDEGRAMMQIVHDVAPDASLCFSTAGDSVTQFASAIRLLRDDSRCGADVIVDDILFFSEPVFSDGQVAQAVNEVATRTTGKGRPVVYVAAAGNQGSADPRPGHGTIDLPNARFIPLAPGDLRLGNIQLGTIAACSGEPAAGGTRNDTAGGWLDFGGGNPVLPLTYDNTGSTLAVQWDDPFDRHVVPADPPTVSTDLNVYEFDAAGVCRWVSAGDNRAIDNAVEMLNLVHGPNGAYRIMVGRTGAGTNLARRVRITNFRGWQGAAFHANAGSPAVFGHPAATGAIAAAASVYTRPATQQSPLQPGFEAFSNVGPATIAFNARGQRLASPELRKKPDLSAPDGVDTTFFPDTPSGGAMPDYEGNGRPNFFGTSAAAPHVAGAAALLIGAGLQTNGTVLTPRQVKTLLQASPPPRLPPYTPGTRAVRGWTAFDGFGMIDAQAAIGALLLQLGF